jgi:hypothetical protein
LDRWRNIASKPLNVRYGERWRCQSSLTDEVAQFVWVSARFVLQMQNSRFIVKQALLIRHYVENGNSQPGQFMEDGE